MNAINVARPIPNTTDAEMRQAPRNVKLYASPRYMAWANAKFNRREDMKEIRRAS